MQGCRCLPGWDPIPPTPICWEIYTPTVGGAVTASPLSAATAWLCFFCFPALLHFQTLLGTQNTKTLPDAVINSHNTSQALCGPQADHKDTSIIRGHLKFHRLTPPPSTRSLSLSRLFCRLSLFLWLSFSAVQPSLWDLSS